MREMLGRLFGLKKRELCFDVSADGDVLSQPEAAKEVLSGEKTIGLSLESKINDNYILPDTLEHKVSGGFSESDSNIEVESENRSLNNLSSATLVETIKRAIESLPLDFQKLPFSSMELTVRTLNVFQRENIVTPADFLLAPTLDIVRWPAFGRKSLNVILDAITDLEKLVVISKSLTSDSNDVEKETAEWLKQINDENVDLLEEVRKFNIQSDWDYLKNRHRLDSANLQKIDKIRYDYLLGKIDISDPLELLKIIPLWLLKMDIVHLKSDTRVKNIIRDRSFKTLSDFENLTMVDLLRIPNLGRKSIGKLAESIIEAEKKGPPPSIESLSTEDGRLIDDFFKCLEKIADSRHRFVIERRLGVNCQSETLEEVAQELGLTRERVRQLQKGQILRIIEGEYWDDLLRIKLENIRNSLTDPLYLDCLGERDKWFLGFEDNVMLLRNLIEHFSHTEVKFLKIEGRIVLANINQEEWDVIKTEILEGLEASISVQYTLDDIEMLVQSKLDKENSSELTQTMIDQISPLLNFTFMNENLTLVSIGNSVVSHIKAILEESPIPLHFSDITKLYIQKYGYEISERNVHARLNREDFLIYDRGTYGTTRHFVTSEDVSSSIKKIIEDLLWSQEDRQWHSEELISSLKEAQSNFEINQVDKYLLNIILSKSDKLKYLGKFIWVKNSPHELELERMHIKSAVYKILKNSGGPMRIEEIKDELMKIRSVGANFCTALQPNELFSRLDPATWGLLERDFVLTLAEWREVKNKIEQIFLSERRSIHISELDTLAKRVGLTSEVKSTQLLGVISSDERFRKWVSGFIGLASWEHPDRISFREAFDKVIDESPPHLTLEQVDSKLKQILDHDFERNKIPVHMTRRGYLFDRASGVWSKSTD